MDGVGEWGKLASRHDEVKANSTPLGLGMGIFLSMRVKYGHIFGFGIYEQNHVHKDANWYLYSESNTLALMNFQAMR